MRSLPQRESLVHQVAGILRESIEAGLWTQHLPGELELCRKFQVSRTTLRGALALLTQEKLIASSQGCRHQVLRAAPRRTGQVERIVKLLTSVPLDQVNGATMLLVDNLRTQLAKDRLEMEVRASPACFTRKPDVALEALTRESPGAVWVLLSAPAAAQRWFMKEGLPCVLLGSQHPGIELPALDADFNAMGQHAARQFLRRGHRRLAVVIPEVDRAGDDLTLAAFQTACAQAGGAQVTLIRHDDTPGGLRHRLEAMIKPPLPTGVFVAHPRHLLLVMSFLATQGIKVPRDISIISRDHEPFLDFVVPRPARYVVPSALFAKKLSQLVLKMVHGEPVPPRGQLLMPAFVPGETLANLSDKKTSG